MIFKYIIFFFHLLRVFCVFGIFVSRYVILFQTEMFLKVRMTGDHQVINGSIKDLSILAGIYNPEKRSDWIYQVSFRLLPSSYSLKH